jgi:peroxiredoxin
MRHRSTWLARCRSMSLKARLVARRCAFELDAAPDLVAAVQRSIRQLAEMELIGKAVKAGDRAPLFGLRCRRGRLIKLSDLLYRGPVVISFFRGDWCPFCVLELRALAETYPEIERLSAALVAVSPPARGRSSLSRTDGEPPFPILQDPECKIATRYRIAFTVPQQFRAAYLALGYPNPAQTRSKSWMLPIPATYVIDSTGLVVLSYLDADHTTRLEPTEIIAALTPLRRASIPSRNNR